MITPPAVTSTARDMKAIICSVPIGMKKRRSNNVIRTHPEIAKKLFATPRQTMTRCPFRRPTSTIPPRLSSRSARPGATPGVLSVEVGVDGVCAARFTPGPDAGPAPAGHDIHLALLAGGISSRVTAGENRGQTLSHEFVVLGTADKALSKDAGSPTERAAVALPHPIAAGATRRALAAWVTRRGELAPLQATGGWLSQP